MHLSSALYCELRLQAVVKYAVVKMLFGINGELLHTYKISTCTNQNSRVFSSPIRVDRFAFC